MKTVIVILLLMFGLGLWGQEIEKAPNEGMAVVAKPSTAIKTDTLFRPSYPEGCYLTKADFIDKKPSVVKAMVVGDLNDRRVEGDSILHHCYFYDAQTGKRFGKVFAVSYKGHLYFQVRAILKHRNKKDRAQSSDVRRSFVRVILGGDNYLYTEVNLVNSWAQGFAFYAGLVGAIAGIGLVKGKGVVWDVKNREFNIFKSCKDYNRFMEVVYPEGVQACVRHQPNIFAVRKTMLKIQ